ncbi:MAG: hypothetical protein IPO21_15405 [Bacteroidales bacterium]|nr:hypothetical protein [Bacteroidales bacterium]
MSEDTINKEELLIHYILGECNETQSKEVEYWLETDIAYSKLHNDYKKIFSATNEDFIEFDVEKAKINFDKQTTVKERSIVKIMLSAAAILALVITTIFYLNRVEIKTVASDKLVQEIKLPDNSSISLNRYTEIRYADNFKDNSI